LLSLLGLAGEASRTARRRTCAASCSRSLTRTTRRRAHPPHFCRLQCPALCASRSYMHGPCSPGPPGIMRLMVCRMPLLGGGANTAHQAQAPDKHVALRADRSAGGGHLCQGGAHRLPAALAEPARGPGRAHKRPRRASRAASAARLPGYDALLSASIAALPKASRTRKEYCRACSAKCPHVKRGCARPVLCTSKLLAPHVSCSAVRISEAGWQAGMASRSSRVLRHAVRSDRRGA